MAKVKLASNIENVKRMYTCYLVTTKSGEEYKYPYDRLSHAQNDKLFAMSDPIPQRKQIKQSPDSGRRHNRGYSPAADVASRCVLVSAGNGKEDRLTVMEVAI